MHHIFINLLQPPLTPKGLLSLWGTDEISGRYLRAEFLYWFFETFFEDRRIDKLCGNIIFFSIVAQEQKLCSNKVKLGERGSKKQFAKIWINFFYHTLYFCLSKRLSFIPFRFVMRKLWTILFFGHSKHLPEKNNLKDSFLNAIFTIKKKSFTWFSFFARTILSLELVHFNSI